MILLKVVASLKANELVLVRSCVFALVVKRVSALQLWGLLVHKLKAAQSGVPIVLMMLLYEARARTHTPRTGASSAQLGPHFGLIGSRRAQKTIKD